VSKSIEDELEERRKILGLPPDIDKSVLAWKVLDGHPLEAHERLFLVRLLGPPGLAARLNWQKRKGKPKSSAAMAKADLIAQSYIFAKTLFPKAKRKDDLRKKVAGDYKVHPSYVDKCVKELDPARRKEFEAKAKVFAARVAEGFKLKAVKAELIES